jgi:hypothetical protein
MGTWLSVPLSAVLREDANSSIRYLREPRYRLDTHSLARLVQLSAVKKVICFVRAGNAESAAV